MRVFFLIFISAFFSCSTSLNDTYQSIDIVELKEVINYQDIIILDVRTAHETSKGYIPDATFIDYYDDKFDEKINLIDRKKSIYVYCKIGGRSKKVAENLHGMGFSEVYNLEGGFIKWKNSNLPYHSDTINFKDLKANHHTPKYFDSVLLNHENVLVYISTKWCTPCRKMEPVIDRFAEEYIRTVKVLKLDLDRHSFLTGRYNIKSIPTYVLYKNNIEVWRKSGIIAYKELDRFFN
jgi:rhodanese-related sulfurtransferase